MTKRNIIISVLLILVAAAVGAYLYVCSSYDGEAVRIEIGRTDDNQVVKEALEAALGESYGGRVYTIWKLFKGRPQAAAGSYLVEPGDKPYAIARRLQYGRQTPFRFTFTNLRTVGDLAHQASTAFLFDSTEFRHAVDSVAAGRFTAEMLPAAFLNDTHEFYRTASAATVASRLISDRDAYWNESRRQRAAALGLNPEQVQIIASIVEAETARADEKPQVARLYINRLQKGMPLQADPTVKFAVGDFGLRRITREHLKVDSPYNTYAAPGLPPGPIAIVGKDAVEHVLAAPAGDQLYMCARSDMSGYHDFTSSYDRHRINAARYHRALNARGIK